jgi:hypothetical protein
MLDWEHEDADVDERWLVVDGIDANMMTMMKMLMSPGYAVPANTVVTLCSVCCQLLVAYLSQTK